MINRILIRTKVVQILYSYLLAQSDFAIKTAPASDSRESKFAFKVYLDILYLIPRLANYKHNFTANTLSYNTQLQALLRSNTIHSAELDKIVPQLQKTLAETSAWQDYTRRRKPTLQQDITLWATLLQTTVLKDATLQSVLRQDPDFSLAAMAQGIRMAVDTLQDYDDNRNTYLKAHNDLQTALTQSRNLYLALLLLIVQLTDEQKDRLEAAKNKYIVTAEDLNPDTRLADNALAELLRENPTIQQFVKDTNFSWHNNSGLIRTLLDQILASEAYSQYLENSEVSLHADAEFWRTVLRTIVFPSDSLDIALEDTSIYWNDDLPVIGTFVLKTLRQIANNSTEDTAGTDPLLPKYKDDDDAEYATVLLDAAIKNHAEYRDMVQQYVTANWDPERLAYMDNVIMTTALAEILTFPQIPIPVTLNEYIEIANNYSTPRSGAFINGILYSVLATLHSQGKLNKPFNIQK